MGPHVVLLQPTLGARAVEAGHQGSGTAQLSPLDPKAASGSCGLGQWPGLLPLGIDLQPYEKPHEKPYENPLAQGHGPGISPEALGQGFKARGPRPSVWARHAVRATHARDQGSDTDQLRDWGTATRS